MKDLREFLTEQEFFIYEAHRTKTYKELAQELNLSISRIGEIKRLAELKIRKEKRREHALLCNHERITVTFMKKELYVIERALIEYLSLLNKRHAAPLYEDDWMADPDYNAGKEIQNKIKNLNI